MQTIDLFKKLSKEVMFINCLLILTIITSLMIVTSNITLMHYEHKLFIILLLVISVTSLASAFYIKNIPKTSVILAITTFIMFGFVFVFGGPLLVPYYNDCNNIYNIAKDGYNIFIDHENCVNYITENPNSTGAEMIDFFVSEKIVKHDILERPPVP